ncbi:GIY-YIG nuclease family protein [Nocardiopsis sp. NPDC049922]|uniref:GIY-YIG nuclease family protein n=1 Tax=Nocardiopsis sp. NPDC049922 TaxID=3155157 RepID=UPI003409BED6
MKNWAADLRFEIVDLNATIHRCREKTYPSGHFVYYLRFCCRIKIGRTTGLDARLKSIPHDEILATEPGDEFFEQMLHAKFDRYHVTGEWFSQGPELVRHVLELRDGAPWDGMPNT